MPVWHLTVAYDGGAYHGWQLQPDRPTVQGILRDRLRILFNAPELRIQGTSRTDAGVHALDQQVTFTPPAAAPELTPEHVRHVLNRWLPRDIRVLDCELREPGFNARFAAAGKAYTYAIANSNGISPFESRYAWVYGKRLDVAAMRAAAAGLEGTHDFASFAANARREAEDTVRTVWRVELLPRGDWLFLNVIGESFLYKMVRAFAGFLVHVGRGSCRPSAVREVLAARNRCAAADSAPPQGLFLARVFWRPDAWRDYVPELPPWRPREPAVQATLAGREMMP
jgi:tRNA pseudouridine38-40 synthase